MHQFLVLITVFIFVLQITRLNSAEESEFQRSATIPLLSKNWLDFNQCDRRCKWVYGNNQWIKGERLTKNQCKCYDGKQNIGIIKRDNDYNPPIMPKTACCGADGVNYSTQEAACTNETYPLHGGYCGACSTHQDINIYNITRNNMTNISSKCAMKYVLSGKKAAITCMNEIVNLSTICTECWVENMGCDAAQCLGRCLIDRVLHINNTTPDGSLNKCLACDQDYCGNPFIVCAGANRRRSGIVSDIDRPQDTIWKRYAC